MSRLALFLLVVVHGTGAVDCIGHPSNSDCAKYHYPNASSDVSMLCSMMSMMPACTIDTICKDHKPSGPFCNPLSVLADGCTDMPGMKMACGNYGKMCAADSVVEECSTYAPIPDLPGTEEVNDAVKSICSSMAMDGCEKCSGGDGQLMDCDLLSVYSELCSAMPDMKECASWEKMCQHLSDWPDLCPSAESPNAAPMMRMYFHTGIVDYVLFKDWVPRSTGGYIATLVAIAAMAASLEGLMTFRARCERYWAGETAPHAAKPGYTTFSDESAGLGRPPTAQWLVQLMRAGLHALEVTVGYFVMLIVMNFNVGMFIAIICGFFFGHLFFDRLRTVVPRSSPKAP